MGSDTVSCLLEESRDLFNKMMFPSDERLIIYHTSFLSMDGRIWLYKKLYWFYYRLIPFIQDGALKRNAVDALGELAYTSTKEKSVVDIIKSHPLLIKIESKRPTEVSEEEDTKGTDSSTMDCLGPNLSDLAVAKFYASQKLTPSKILGKMVVALPRHTIEHAFDKDTRQVLSMSSTDAEPKRLWRYSLEQVVDLLRSILPAHLLKAQETFLRKNLWPHLKIDNFWAQDLTWMGGVPKPSKEEIAAIKKVSSYGKRRQQARKFDQYNRGTSAVRNQGGVDHE
ncbi:hypothetical protein C2845_PM10G13410 [Panicum miliaceum]|uniref:Uncharacterized protein n=1 Tax=Panicum miliaceum TaxID=4540 RepID=A0A3L6PD05_PANMI|nr:hypothetical protein C2845_PM10G13410 [Panicum miliaceum]